MEQSIEDKFGMVSLMAEVLSITRTVNDMKDSFRKETSTEKENIIILRENYTLGIGKTMLKMELVSISTKMEPDTAGSFKIT